MKTHRDGGAETEHSTTGNTMNTKPMINTIRSNITTALICGVLLGTTMFATAAGPKIASGSASFYEDGGTFAVGTYNLAFSAVQHADGTVTGQAQVSWWTVSWRPSASKVGNTIWRPNSLEPLRPGIFRSSRDPN
jgi:hypothetical protein